MGTKQVKMKFQVVADDGISANVTVTVGGIQKFSGALAKTVEVMPGQVLYDQTPFNEIEFDLDVADLPTPTASSRTVLTDVSISVTGGSITLQETKANYTVTSTPSEPPTKIPGNATEFYTLHFGTQPVWTPPATGRLLIADNSNTGPGSLLLLDGESVAYQVAMTWFSA